MIRTILNTGVCLTICSMLLTACGPKPQVEDIKKEAETLSPVEKSLLTGGIQLFQLPKTRSQEELASAVAAHMGGIKYCYQKNLDLVGKGKGQVIVEFIIRTDGSVTDVEVIETFVHAPEFLACIKEAVKRWRFDRIADDGDEPKVFYPFEFGY